MRFALMLAAATLVGCAADPAAVDVHDGPAIPVVSGSNAGGVTFAAGSGCTVALSHFECSFTVEGVGSDLFAISQRASWTYTYQCLHKKTFRPSRTPAAQGQTTTTDLRTATGSNDQITISGTVLSPVSPTDCAANRGPYRVTQMLSPFTPNSWSLYAYKNDDPDNYFASLFEVL